MKKSDFLEFIYVIETIEYLKSFEEKDIRPLSSVKHGKEDPDYLFYDDENITEETEDYKIYQAVCTLWDMEEEKQIITSYNMVKLFIDKNDHKFIEFTPDKDVRIIIEHNRWFIA